MTGTPEDGPYDDPPTASSRSEPVVPSYARPVPSVGVWVGPPDDPARYERLEHVGGGAEGTIHRARLPGRDGGPDTFVALKQYRRPREDAPDWPRDGTWQQIRDQAWLLSGLRRSRHLVHVRDYFLGSVGPGDADALDTPFVVMGWVEGTTLTDALRTPAPLAVRLQWIHDLADAVDVLHSLSRTDEHPLVHGDIKPDNCVITGDRGLVLVDTGALQRADRLGNRQGLRSPPYAAPEVLAAPGSRRGVATDLYSLGAVAMFVLTGRRPPDATSVGYLAAAQAALHQHLHAPATVRPLVVAHVLKLLDPDPERRSGAGATVWANDLAELLTPPPAHRRRRRVIAIAVGGAVVAAGAVLVPVTVNGQGAATACAAAPTAVAPAVAPTSTADSPNSWPRRPLVELPVFTAGCGPALYEQSFSTRSPEWPDTTAEGYATRWTDTGYQLHVTGSGVFESAPAPTDVSAGDEVVSATATVTSGQGAWGIWCRGTDKAGSRRYEFVVSHAGAVQIVEPDGEYGTGWMYATGLDMAEPVTLSARCADVAGSLVELTLAVNGRVALVYRPRTLLGPGFAGVEGMTFSDVDGPTITASYERFDIRRPAV